MSTDRPSLHKAYEIGHLVDRLMRRIEAGLHAKAPVFDPLRIGAFGGMVLLTLAEVEPAPMQTLVSVMRRDKSQMTRIIQTLEAKGVVERQASPTDGRVSLLRLTPQGHQFLGGIKVTLSSVIDEIMAPLSEADRAALTSILRKL